MTDLEYRVQQLEKKLYTAVQIINVLVRYADMQMIRDDAKVNDMSVMACAAMLEGYMSVTAKRSE